ncbi:MAG TPA: hypothetical protein VFR07_10400 [Mycobacteriales bacterium]|nr:hypothetical protein [Mycobacteriales bacterium]
MLVSTGCTGSCARGPVVALSQHLQVHRDGPGPGVQVQFGAVIWLGPVGGQQLSALCQWLGQDQGSAVLPRSLRPAVFVPQPTGASSV